MELKLENGLAKYKVALENTRNLFGIIPMKGTETVSVNAETGKVDGYDRPWWSIISSGKDVINQDANIE
ncbi:MAG: hypothetical protein NTY48_00940 [Candidatus Diapherotrites archaeon]|nr:hypothetical protein [Candidatus Diapherotrites archaeon]